MAIRDENLSVPVLLTAITTKIGDTVPTGERWTINKMVLANRSGSDATATVYRVDSGTPAEKHKILAGFTVRSGDTVSAPVAGLILEKGWSLHAQASVNDAVTFNCVVRKDKQDV